MHKIVSTVFKTIMTSMILIVVVSVTFFVARVRALDSKINALASTLCSEVSKNNYLPEDAYNMYASILNSIKESDSELIDSWEINYKQGGSASDFSSGTNLAVPLAYGDVATVEIRVHVNVLRWGTSNASGGISNMNDATVSHGIKRTYKYTYQVPCLRYVK